MAPDQAPLPRRSRWPLGLGLVGLACIALLALVQWQGRRRPAAPADLTPAARPPPDALELVQSDDSVIASPWAPTADEVRQAAAAAVQTALAEAAAQPWPDLPAAGGPDLATRQARQREWMRRFFVESYAQVGQHSPAWDEAARAFLAEASRRASERGDDQALVERLVRASQALAATGCTDPWIQYWQANLVDVTRGPAAAESLLRQALTGLEGSRYPRLMAFFAARRLSYALAQQRGFEDTEVQDARRRMYVHLGEAAGDAMIAEEGGRDIYARELELTLMGRRQPGELAPAAAAAAALTGPDPWAAAMVQQAHHSELGWAARGQGWGDTVTEAAAKEFETRLQTVYDLCLNGWEKAPHRPELAARLLEISRPRGDAAAQRLWFERAVTAQFDYVPAYNSLIMGLMPRWGGSLGALLAFGDALQRTGRYDTAVPFYALTSASRLGEELGPGWREVWRAETVAAWATAVCRGYAGQASAVLGLSPEAMTTLEVACLWAAGRYAAAAAAAATLPQAPQPAALDHLMRHARPDIIALETGIGTGRFGAPAREALAELDRGALAEAQARLTAVTPGNAEEAMAWAYLLERVADRPLDPAAADIAEHIAVLARSQRREALLLAYARAYREHGEAQVLALTPAVGTAVGPLAYALGATMPPVGALGRADIARALAEIDRIVADHRQRPEFANAPDSASRLEAERAIARLRWLLRAEVSHERSPCELYASRIIGHEIRAIGEPGLILDFMSEWLRPEMMNATLAGYVGQLVHDSVVLTGDRRRTEIDGLLAELAALTDASELETRAWQAFATLGTPRLNLRLAQLLAERGRHAAAGRIDRRVRSWMERFSQATEGLGVWSPWQCMATFNRVAGFEDEVLYYGGKALAYQALNSSHYICASACLRRGWTSQAVRHLLEGRPLPDDADEFEDPEGVYAGTGPYLTHLLEVLLRSRKATEKELAALREAFPEAYAQAQEATTAP